MKKLNRRQQKWIRLMTGDDDESKLYTVGSKGSELAFFKKNTKMVTKMSLTYSPQREGLRIKDS